MGRLLGCCLALVMLDVVSHRTLAAHLPFPLVEFGVHIHRAVVALAVVWVLVGLAPHTPTTPTISPASESKSTTCTISTPALFATVMCLCLSRSFAHLTFVFSIDPLLSSPDATAFLTILPFAISSVVVLRVVLPLCVSPSTSTLSVAWQILAVVVIWLNHHQLLDHTSSAHVLACSLLCVGVVCSARRARAAERPVVGSSHSWGGLVDVRVAVAVVLGVVLCACVDCDAWTNCGRNAVVLQRTDNNLGSLQVVHDSKRGFKFLKVGPSIVGGLWDGFSPPESIFGVFHILEAAAQFVAPPTAEQQPAALVLGQGIGVVTRALLARGFAVDVVDIDSRITQSSVEWFGFSAPQTPPVCFFHVDARDFIATGGVAKLSANHSSPSCEQTQTVAHAPKAYAVVVHDLFVGGGVTLELLSKEVFQRLRAIMTRNGDASSVLCVNVFASLTGAGAFGLSVLVKRLQQTFASVRVFSEDRPYTPQQDQHALRNVVVFAGDAVPLSMRAVSEADLSTNGSNGGAGSVRAQTLQAFHKFEVDTRQLSEMHEKQSMGAIEEDAELQKWAAWVAVEHWKLMGKVHTSEFWKLH